jgi:hypothetical protein
MALENYQKEPGGKPGGIFGHDCSKPVTVEFS